MKWYEILVSFEILSISIILIMVKRAPRYPDDYDENYPN